MDTFFISRYLPSALRQKYLLPQITTMFFNIYAWQIVFAVKSAITIPVLIISVLQFALALYRKIFINNHLN